MGLIASGVSRQHWVGMACGFDYEASYLAVRLRAGRRRGSGLQLASSLGCLFKRVLPRIPREELRGSLRLAAFVGYARRGPVYSEACGLLSSWSPGRGRGLWIAMAR